MVTIKEIAKAAGVSPATVSRVLNYDPGLSLSEAKRQAVIEAAEALNYATPRARNRAQTGLIVPAPRVAAGLRLAIVHFLEPADELVDPYFIGVRLGIENRCRELRIELVKLFHSQTVAETALLQDMSGVIAIGRHSRDEVDWLAKHCRHLVFADFVPKRDDIDCVRCDLVLATRQILDGLKQAGYRRIAFIGGQDPVSADGVPFGEQRASAYRDWQRIHGQFDEKLLALGEPDGHGQTLRLEVGYEQAKRILSLPERPDAVIAANDNMAIGAYRAIQESGLSVPGDIAVVSYNDIPVAQFLNPPLSTMRILSEAIGETSVDLMVERLNGRDYSKHVIIPSRMIWRDSTRRP
jgi:LacI family transcriptional regulator